MQPKAKKKSYGRKKIEWAEPDHDQKKTIGRQSDRSGLTSGASRNQQTANQAEGSRKELRPGYGATSSQTAKPTRTQRKPHRKQADTHPTPTGRCSTRALCERVRFIKGSCKPTANQLRTNCAPGGIASSWFAVGLQLVCCW